MFHKMKFCSALRTTVAEHFIINTNIREYYYSKGCKYMLMRKIGKNKVATLKRQPRPEEMASFNVSMYPTTRVDFSVTAWAAKSKKYPNSHIQDLIASMGMSGASLVDKIFQVS